MCQYNNRIQLEKAVEKINLEIVNQEEGSKSSYSPRSPRNKARFSKNEEEEKFENISTRIKKMDRQKSKSIYGVKFLSQSRRDMNTNLRKSSKNRSKRVTYFVKPENFELGGTTSNNGLQF